MQLTKEQLLDLLTMYIDDFKSKYKDNEELCRVAEEALKGTYSSIVSVEAIPKMKVDEPFELSFDDVEVEEAQFTEDGTLICPKSWEDGWND